MNGPLIVVVEDDECIRSAITEVLEMEDYRVLAFPNGLEASKALKGMPHPCVILLDWMMPIMGGEEFLKERESLGDTFLQIPVIVLSAVSEKACGKPGVKSCLGKPVDLNRLLETIQSCCYGRQCA